MALSSTSSSSPPASPQQYGTILTPSRKVRALLAQFDDSDSDQSAPVNYAVTASNPVGGSELPHGNVAFEPESPPDARSEHQESDDEVVPFGPRGRLAAQMQTASFNLSHEDTGAQAYARIKDQIEKMSRSKAKGQEAITDHSSGDDLQRSAPRRRSLKENNGSFDEHYLARESRSPSPLFFPSPLATRSPAKGSAKRGSREPSDSEELLEDPLKQNGSKFLALVEKHRKRRLAKQAADEAKRAERLQQLKKAGSKGPSGFEATLALNGQPDDSDDISDLEIEERLTQQVRPTRKASKKALDEMSRETQRMHRGMQLAHQAKIKKKITKESLLARFNFHPSASDVGQSKEVCHASTTASSTPASDVEEVKDQRTPSTSPLPSEERNNPNEKAPALPKTTGVVVHEEDEEIYATEDLPSSQPTSLDKGKGKAVAVDEVTEIPKTLVVTRNQPQVAPIQPKGSNQDAVIVRDADSDSDLEIVAANSKAKKFAVFERLPQRKARETNPHLILRSLAHLQTAIPEKKHASMNVAELETHLRSAARMQARKEREEKLEELRAKGVFIQTAEDREREQQEVEDLVEQARVEGAEIERREKETAKKDGTFVKDQLDDDNSEDEDDADFCDENEEVEEQVSDSEEEEEEGNSEVEQEDDLHTERDLSKLRVSELQRADMTEQHADPQLSEDDSQKTFLRKKDVETSEGAELPGRPARSRRLLILSDDESDEEDDIQGPLPPQVTKTPPSVLRSARKVIPGLQMSDDLPIGLTQAFAATMGESETQDGAILTQEQDSLALTYDLPSPQFPKVPSLNRLESLDMITDSQPASQTQPLNLDLCLVPKESVPQSPAGMSSTQLSFVPTQDVGYVMSPFKEDRFDTQLAAPHSTIDTVIVPQEEDCPAQQRKGRLRRGRAAPTSDDEAVDSEHLKVGIRVENSALAALKHAASQANGQNLFDKSKSNAREVVDEAAEESEDEYAGLGGESDDEDGEEDEADRHMIDHDEKLGQDEEGKLAGFYADKERKKDEAAVSKLMKDITTGALRRKRGAAAELDLSDEEDAYARRREVKRREFARMRRELLKDEAVGKIADDKKKQAFMKSIEDRDEAENDDFGLNDEEQTKEDSQSQSQPETNYQAEPIPTENRQTRKRPLEPSAADILNRLPPTSHLAGVKSGTFGRKPSTLAEIREQVSFLVEEPNSQKSAPDNPSSDDEALEPETYVNLDRHLHHADEENESADEGLAGFIVDDEIPAFKKPQLPTTRAPAHERRTKANVIDRLSLLRQTSSSSSSASSSHPGSKLAFLSAKSSDTASSALKVPSLLRRATTNSSFNSDSGASVSATGVTERGAVEQEKEMIRKAQGGKKSAINYYAKGRVEERDKVRQGRVMKSSAAAAAARKTTGKGKKGGFLGGLFGGGSWE